MEHLLHCVTFLQIRKCPTLSRQIDAPLRHGALVPRPWPGHQVILASGYVASGKIEKIHYMKPFFRLLTAPSGVSCYYFLFPRGDYHGKLLSARNFEVVFYPLIFHLKQKKMMSLIAKIQQNYIFIIYIKWMQAQRNSDKPQRGFGFGFTLKIIWVYPENFIKIGGLGRMGMKNPILPS